MARPIWLLITSGSGLVIAAVSLFVPQSVATALSTGVLTATFVGVLWYAIETRRLVDGQERAGEALDTDGVTVVEGAVPLVHSLPPDAWAIATSGTRDTAMGGAARCR